MSTTRMKMAVSSADLSRQSANVPEAAKLPRLRGDERNQARELASHHNSRQRPVFRAPSMTSRCQTTRTMAIISLGPWPLVIKSSSVERQKRRRSTLYTDPFYARDQARY